MLAPAILSGAEAIQEKGSKGKIELSDPRHGAPCLDEIHELLIKILRMEMTYTMSIIF